MVPLGIARPFLWVNSLEIVVHKVGLKNVDLPVYRYASAPRRPTFTEFTNFGENWKKCPTFTNF